MADIFDKVVAFLRESPIVTPKDRATAMGTLYRRSPLDNAGPWIELDGRRILQFSTNDYLGLARHPRLRQAAAEIVSKFGVSAPMGARPLTGTTELHEELERNLADFKLTERALAFSSGAYAMIGCVAALAGPKDVVVLDQHAHASLVCGARISGARMKFFQHNDPADLDAVLLKISPSQAKMVVVDGVYSMQGDIAPLAEICDVCQKHGARLIVDDAHGTGVLGKNGRGAAELLGVEDRIDLHLGTCSKALATTGGFAAGDARVIEFLQFNAPTILFTKAMPACVAAATIESLKLLREGHELRKALWENTRLFQRGLIDAGFDIGSTQTPITPIHGNGTDAVHMSTALYRDCGIWVNAVLYPAVPLGTSILRAIPTAAHSRQDIETLLKAITALKHLAHQAPAAATNAPGRARVMNDRLHIQPVEGRRARKRFADLPFALYRGDPHWAPPLVSAQMKVLAGKTAFFDHAQMALFLAERAGRPVGRIAAIHNHAHNDFHHDDVGFFGFFECDPADAPAANALFAAAEGWLLARGLGRKLRGPASPSMHDQCGLLIDGFDAMAMPMMPYNPKSYVGLIESAGLAKCMDLLAYRVDRDRMAPDAEAGLRLRRLGDALTRRHPEVRLRCLDMRNFRRDLLRFVGVFEEARRNNWGYVPVTEAELAETAGQLRRIVDPELNLLAEVNGEPAGALLVLPNFNPALAAVKGRLWPFGFIRFFRELRATDQMRVLGVAALEKYRRLGITATLFCEFVLRSYAKGCRLAEASWVLENNQLSDSTIRNAFNPELYKTYRMYEKRLSATRL